MSDYVWCSSAFRDSTLALFVETDITNNDREAAIKGNQLNRNGEAVPAYLCPKRIWAVDDVEQYQRMPSERMPDLFFAQTQFIVSAKAALILEKCDLGEGALYPVSEGIFEEDKSSRVLGDWFCWTIGNTKAAFLPEETSNKRRFGVSGQRWNMPSKLKDEDIAVSHAALLGPDVWLDHGLFQAIFLSKRLGNALEEAGLNRAFRIHKARVSS